MTSTASLKASPPDRASFTSCSERKSITPILVSRPTAGRDKIAFSQRTAQHKDPRPAQGPEAALALPPSVAPKTLHRSSAGAKPHTAELPRPRRASGLDRGVHDALPAVGSEQRHGLRAAFGSS